MRFRPLAVLAAAGLCIAPALADRKKTAHAPETTPQPMVVSEPILRASAPCVNDQPSQHFATQSTYVVPLELNTKIQHAASRSEERTVVKSYSVGDLVIPLPPTGVGAEMERTSKTLEADLIKKITAAVEPASWSSAGGTGTIDYYPLGMALVVNQTPQVQAALEKYLDTLRRISDQQVMTEIHLITVSDAWFEKTNLARSFTATEGCCKDAASRARGLTPEIAARLVRSAQADADTTIMQSPRITTLTGQPGRIKVGQTEHFVTGISVQTVKGSLVYTPKNEPVDLGVDLTLEPAVAADGKHVKLAITGSVRELGVIPVAMTPLVTQIRPINDEGKRCDPVPFTQYIQEPVVVTRSVSDTLTVPSGGTALLYGGKAAIEETVKERLPMLADVPVLAELFVRDRKVSKTNHLLVLVTSRVMNADAGCEECADCPRVEDRLTKLVAEYRRACQNGQTEEARRLAIECLAVDPTCFGKN